MNAQRWILAAAVIGFAAGTVTVAHHSNTQFYDLTKKVEIQGAVTKFVFKNPHGFLHLDAIDAAGQKTEWQIELGAPVSLSRTGWTPETIKAGMVLKAVGSPARIEGAHGMCCAAPSASSRSASCGCCCPARSGFACLSF